MKNEAVTYKLFFFNIVPLTAEASVLPYDKFVHRGSMGPMFLLSQ